MKKYTLRQQFDGLPWGQLIALALMRFGEPLAFTSIFPYINYLVESFHVCEEHEIARYAGFLTGAFALSQCFTGIWWGRMADKYGRKPIILYGMLGSLTCVFCFGLSKNFYLSLAIRVMAGMLQGMSGVIRTLLGEIAKERRHQAISFSIFPLLWQVGCVIGPLIGGYTQQPVKLHPEWFRPGPLNPGGDPNSFFGETLTALFIQFPFLMPNLIVASLMLNGSIICALFLDETHEDFKDRRDRARELGRWLLGEPVSSASNETARQPLLGRRKSPTRVSTREVGQDEQIMDTAVAAEEGRVDSRTQGLDQDSPLIKPVDLSWSAILTTQVQRALWAVFTLNLHTVVFEELLPVYLLTRAEDGSNPGPNDRGPSKFPLYIVGGMGMNSEDVGGILSLTGVVGFVVMVGIFPWLDANFGSLRPYRWMCWLVPPIYFTLPYYNLMLSWHDPEMVKFVVSVIVSWRTVINAIIHPSLLLISYRVRDDPRHLSTINGCVQVTNSFARFIGPIVWGYFMSYGQTTTKAWMPWWLLTLTAIAGIFQAYTISVPGEGEDDEDDEDEDE